VAGRIRSIEKSNDLIGIRTHDLPACSVVPQLTTLPRAPEYEIMHLENTCTGMSNWGPVIFKKLNKIVIITILGEEYIL
jgi:hypothetical protein